MGTAADQARSKKKGSLNSTSPILDGRSTFLSVAFIGLVMIFLGEPLNSPIMLGVLGPITIMILYMVFGLLGYIEIADSESFADSIYYLGFVLTLISLAAALFYLRNDNPQLGLLVSKFGLALLTTIVGLCVRVSIVNFRVSGNDARRTADERLSRAVGRFTKDIELTSEKLRLLLNGSLDHVTTTANEVSLATTQATKAMQVETKRTSEHIKELHEKSEKQWEETVTKLAGDLDIVVRTATEFSIDRLKALNEKINNEMDSFYIPRDIVSGKIEPALGEFQVVVENFVSNMKSLASASAGHEELNQQFNDLSSALNSGSKSIKALQNHSEKLTSSYGEIDLLGQKFKDLNNQLTKGSLSLDQWGLTLENSTDILSTGTNTSKLSIDTLADEVKNLVKLSREQSIVISDIVNKIKEDAENGHEAMNLLQNNLIESSHVIVKHLEPQ